MSSDDLFGEDEIESVRPGHVEALGAAEMSLESDGGVIVAPPAGGVLLAASPSRRAWRPSLGAGS